MDLFFSVFFGVLGYVSGNLLPILVGAIVMLAFLVLFLHRNLKTRPDWVFKILARYASKLEPISDWYERMHTLLIQQRIRMEQEKQAK